MQTVEELIGRIEVMSEAKAKADPRAVINIFATEMGRVVEYIRCLEDKIADDADLRSGTWTSSKGEIGEGMGKEEHV